MPLYQMEVTDNDRRVCLQYSIARPYYSQYHHELLLPHCK